MWVALRQDFSEDFETRINLRSVELQYRNRKGE
jgi:hypothetical protein